MIEPVSAEVIAERLFVAPGTVRQWCRRKYLDFPKPISRRYGVNFYDWGQVKDWAETHNR